MRQEHFERMRRNLELQHAELSAANKDIANALCAYDPGRPWNEVLRLAVNETAFWDKEVKDKAVKFMNSSKCSWKPVFS